MVSEERVRVVDMVAGPELAAKPCLPALRCFLRRPLAASDWLPPSGLRNAITLYTSTGYTLPFTCTTHDSLTKLCSKQRDSMLYML